MSQQFKNNKYSALFVSTEHKKFGKNENTKVAPAPYSGVFATTREEIRAAHQATQVHLPRTLTPPPRPACEVKMSVEDKKKIIQCKLDDLYEGKKDLQDLIESLKTQKRTLNQSIIDERKGQKVPEKKSERTNINSFTYRANQGVSHPGFTYNPQLLNCPVSDITPAEYASRHKQWLYQYNNVDGWVRKKAEEGVYAR